MTMHWTGTGGRGGVTVNGSSNGLALIVGHHRELNRHGPDAIERFYSSGNTMFDLVTQRTTHDGQSDLYADLAIRSDAYPADHPEVDDGSTKLRILNRA